VRAPTIGLAFVKTWIWFFVGVCAVPALEVNLGEIVILSAAR
jgi:hypothetical protein